MIKLHQKKQQGSSLIEVLIAIVVISIGLLGLAGLQTQSIKSNHSSYLRSQATFLAYDLSDRMRMARAAAISGHYDRDSNVGVDNEPNVDKAHWNNLVTDTLGADAVATITRPTSNSPLVTISISWNDDRGRIRDTSDTNVATETFTFRTEL